METSASEDQVVNSPSQWWKPSRFNVQGRDDGGRLILYNSYTGAVGVVPEEDRIEVSEALKNGTNVNLAGILSDLQEGGFLVSQGVDELRGAAFLQHREMYRTDLLNLILLPTEDCNFRCVYCYENFKRSTMPESIREGLKRFVEREADRLRFLHIGWFGGEPLTALEVIEELSASFLETCRDNGIDYKAGITTNAYPLTRQVAQSLFSLDIRRFQITLDGPQSEHDKRRVLANGKGTFEGIMANLQALRALDEIFQVEIRVNFDRDSLSTIPELLEILKLEFLDDPRFAVHFRPIGQLGGPNDASLPVCNDQSITFDLYETALEYGLGVDMLNQDIAPHGTVCYAARPNSFVIGSDGTIYKCTVAFEDQANKIGRLEPDGEMLLDEDKLALWTATSCDDDPTCQKCYFRPSCQGAVCPLKRIREGVRTCPPAKKQIKRVLELISRIPDQQ